jgi:hypothetical protein
MFETTWEVAYYDGEESEPVRPESTANVEHLMKIFGMK